MSDHLDPTRGYDETEAFLIRRIDEIAGTLREEMLSWVRSDLRTLYRPCNYENEYVPVLEAATGWGYNLEAIEDASLPQSLFLENLARLALEGYFERADEAQKEKWGAELNLVPLEKNSEPQQ